MCIPLPTTPQTAYAASSPCTAEPMKSAQTLFSGTNQCLPCVRRRKLPCSGGVGTACGGGRVVNGCICYVINTCKPTTPQSPNGDSSTKARLRMPQALLRCPYTGEPIEVRTNLIQRHKLTPPLCKGRGTAHGGGRVVKILV